MDKQQSPRYWAWKILNKVESEKAWAERSLETVFAKEKISDVDKRLCRELVLGIIKNYTALDYQLEPLLKNKQWPKKRQLNLLRLGIYQQMFLDKIPAHAVVHETVNLAKQCFSPGYAGFVNAILRRFIRESRRELPGKKQHPVDYCRIAYSFPEFICEQWINQFGLDQAEAMMQVANRPPPIVIRVNLLKISREALMKKFATAGILCRPGPLAMSIVISKYKQEPSTWPGYWEGLFYFQDSASQMIGLLADPKANQRWLDLCAAPGGKATHMAELMHDQGEVSAYDFYPEKRKRIEENIRRLDLKSIKIIKNPAQVKMFDGVLVDAPCSGFGTLRRHAESKRRITIQDIHHLAEKQLQLLEQAAAKVKPGGVLIYSTCTTTIEENEEVVKKFIKKCQNFMIQTKDNPTGAYCDKQGFFRTYPGWPELDGMFAVRMRKIK